MIGCTISTCRVLEQSIDPPHIVVDVVQIMITLRNGPANGRCMSGLWDVTVSFQVSDDVNASKIAASTDAVRLDRIGLGLGWVGGDNTGDVHHGLISFCNFWGSQRIDTTLAAG